MIRTVHGHGYQFVGLQDEPAVDEGPEQDEPQRSAPTPVRFATVAGGRQLAIGESGSGPALLKVANWMTHVVKDADSPLWRHWVRDLSRYHRFIRYDARGCGLSNRDLADFPLNDLDLWVDDLARVVDAVDIDRFALLGISQGGPLLLPLGTRTGSVT